MIIGSDPWRSVGKLFDGRIRHGGEISHNTPITVGRWVIARRAWMRKVRTACRDNMAGCDLVRSCNSVRNCNSLKVVTR